MFGKKQEPDVWSSEDIQMKTLLESMYAHRKSMQSLCYKILMCKGSAEMLPDGADKNIELQEIETAQKRILNLVAAYDDDLREYKKINGLRLTHFTGKTVQPTSHEALHLAWKLAYRQVIGT